MIFNNGEIVKVLDNTSDRIYRQGLVIKSYKDAAICKVQMLDCNELRICPINQLKKGEIK
tara:strand:- start:14 stop:193 length:180 start_codon:yes stop_codon:yes gene_type:complete